MDDELSNERVVVWRHVVAWVDMRVEPDAGPAGGAVELERAGRGFEPIVRILGIDTTFNGHAVYVDAALLQLEPAAAGDAKLLVNDVHAGDHLGHGVLDLEPCVHLHEVEAAAAVDKKLDRAGIDVLHGRRKLERGLGNRLAEPALKTGRGRFLDQLLVAALQAAIAHAEMDAVAVAVAEYLHLDMTRPLDVLLDVEGGVLEGGLGFPLRQEEAVPEGDIIVDDAHPFSAAAAGRLDDDRIADPLGDRDRLLGRLNHLVAPGHGWNLAGLGGLDRLVLLPAKVDNFGRRADEAYVAALTDLGEVRVFGQKSATGVDCLDVGDLCGRDNARDVQIAFAARGGADADGIIGEAQVQGIAVSLGIDRDRLDAQILARADNAQGDLATISY